MDGLGSSVSEVGRGLLEDEKKTLIAEQRLWADHMLRRSARAASYMIEARAEAQQPGA